MYYRCFYNMIPMLQNQWYHNIKNYTNKIYKNITYFIKQNRTLTLSNVKLID